ncbi:MAG TPA: DUF4349 domain-containing protein [Solirubrobacteraceae bacterium]|jgi:hypothetical protein|nr:DUF4349 domain-containing protein [Solirubrobacteraceae bacterium]
MSRALAEAVARDLKALDAALAGEQSPLSELVADVRACSPPIDPALEATLADRVRAGFPAPPRPRRPRPRPLWMGAGVAGLLAAALLVVVLAGGTGHRPAVPIPVTASPSAPAVSAGAEGAAAGGASVGPAPRLQAHSAPQSSAAASAPSAAAPAGAPAVRRQQLGAQLTLATGSGQLDTVAGEVARAATDAGGYVQNSQVNDSGHGAGQAEISLVVPSGQLASVLTELGQLARVQSESRSAIDITQSYDAARLALQDAVATRAALLRALARATTSGQLDSLEQRLSLAAGDVRGDANAYNALARAAGESQVLVSVVTGSGGGGGSSGAFGIGGGWHDAGRVLSVALGAPEIAAAALAPLAVLAILVGLGLRPARRVRDERALDAA